MTRPHNPGAARSRREARERAVELAYEAEMRGVDVDQLLAGLPLPPDAFTVELLRAAETGRDRADELIAKQASGWTLERMPAMDLLVMRMAVAELIHLATPTGVVLAESVELASRYSTEESSRFVNGVLAALARTLRP
ncbi:MAG: transcription antitermination factor NusB [Actinomycetota bacterium]